MPRRAFKMSLPAVRAAAMLGRQEELMAEEKCMMRFVPTVALQRRYPLYQRMTDQSIAEIVIRTTGNSLSWAYNRTTNR